MKLNLNHIKVRASFPFKKCALEKQIEWHKVKGNKSGASGHFLRKGTFTLLPVSDKGERKMLLWYRGKEEISNESDGTSLDYAFNVAVMKRYL